MRDRARPSPLREKALIIAPLIIADAGTRNKTRGLRVHALDIVNNFEKVAITPP